MKQILFLFIFLSLANTGVYSAEKQKTPKEVKLATLHKAANLAIKNSSGQDNAKKNLMEAVNRQNLTFKDKANIYYTCALLDESSNSIQNTKAYLKQVCDTAALFSTLLNMYGNLYK